MIFAVAMTACAASGPSDYDNGKMRKDMTAFEYSVDMGIGLNLGNTMESYWENKSNKTSGAATIGENSPLNYETCWGAVKTTQEIIDGMKEAGFSTVRVPVYWGNMMQDDGTFTIDDTYFRRVEQIINYCRADGLYVVINVHHYDEFIVKNFDKNKALEITEKIWTQIAERYKDYSDYLVFEGFNEAMGTVREGDSLTEDEIYDYVNSMNQTFVSTVRKTGGNNKNRLLIASGYWTNIDNTTKDKFVMPEDTVKDKLMVSVHYIDNNCYWGNRIGSDYWLEYSTAQCELLKKAFIDKGIPVFVGECTGIYSDERFDKNAEITESSECLSTIMNMAVDYGLTPVIWDDGNAFYSRLTCKLTDDKNAAVIKEISQKISEKNKKS